MEGDNMLVIKKGKSKMKVAIILKAPSICLPVSEDLVIYAVSKEIALISLKLSRNFVSAFLH